MFGRRVPTFNLEGDDEVKTRVGGFVSLLLIYTTLLYALLKVRHLLEYKNP